MSKPTVELQGDQLHLKDEPAGEDEAFPAFRVVDGALEPVDFDEGPQDRVHIITTAISVDTPVCATQYKTFDQHAANFEGEDIEVWYVTRDVPFALNRFAEEHDLDHVQFLSDYNFREFGEATGLAVEETELLSRATFVIDRDGEVVYREVLDEIADEPDYDAAVEAAREAAGK
ncbi:MAG: thiol peroxidase [Bradymonadaceae bacterium]